MSALTSEEVRWAIACMHGKAMRPLVVATDEEARQLRAADPFGHLWRRGDTYFLPKQLRATVGAKR